MVINNKLKAVFVFNVYNIFSSPSGKYNDYSGFFFRAFFKKYVLSHYFDIKTTVGHLESNAIKLYFLSLPA